MIIKKKHLLCEKEVFSPCSLCMLGRGGYFQGTFTDHESHKENSSDCKWTQGIELTFGSLGL